ncbi:MAG: hypothetical protein PVI00_02010 [Desulfobacterales bacterium]|jgi:hypothetical protein
MDVITWLLNTIDPVLIAPYRWFANPMLGWWIGTFILALWATLIGELTLAVAYRINRNHIAKNLEQTQYYHQRSLNAKAAGDESAYKGINRLANEAFGKSFFLFMAMGMASLWPAFFAAAWLNRRFADIVFTLPKWAGGLDLNFIAPFVILYIFARVLFGKLKPYLPFLNQFARQLPKDNLQQNRTNHS